MQQNEPRREIVEHTSPAWRLLAVGLFFGGLFFGGWFARLLGLVDQFATFFVVTAFTAFLFWARKRPDKLRRRFGAFGKVAIAIQESADDIRASIFSKSVYYGVLFGAAYAVLVIAAKALVVATVTSLFAWQILAAVGCLVAAVVVAPQFFAAVGQHVSIPDEDYPEEPRRVDSEEVRETLPEAQNRPGDEEEEEEEDSRKADASAIGFYDEEGNQLSQEEFEELFANSDGEDE